MNNAIKTYYTDMLSNNKKIDSFYPSYRISSFNIEKLAVASYLKEAMESESDIKYDSKHQNIKSYVEKMSKREREECINNFPSYMDILDSKFHTIISPKYLGPQKFWTVIASYCRAYLALVVPLLGQKVNRNCCLNILKNPKKTYEDLINSCLAYRDIDSYYKSLRKSTINPYIITTNYTPLSKIITECEENNIAYLNGRFGLFESAHDLEVIDVNCVDDAVLKEDVYFPYIFVQSGVKPIVESMQIEEYHKAIGFLNASDELIVVGYNFNSDDNHINSIIREFILKPNKKITYFKYNKDTCDKKIADVKSEIIKKLRLDWKTEQKEVMKKINIIQDVGDNLLKQFNQYISQL